MDRTRLQFGENVITIIIRNWNKEITMVYNIIKQSIGLELYAKILKE